MPATESPQSHLSDALGPRQAPLGMDMVWGWLKAEWQSELPPPPVRASKDPVTACDSGLIPKLPGPGKARFLTQACCKVVGGTGTEEQGWT